MEIFNFEPWAIVLMVVFGGIWLISTIADLIRKSRAKKQKRSSMRPPDVSEGE